MIAFTGTERENRQSSGEASPVSLHSNLDAALADLRPQDLESADVDINRIFIIGGATLYKETLELPPSSSTFIDRILLTRIISPSFDECDVFLPDFQKVGEGSIDGWSRSAHVDLQAWVGFDVPAGVREEKGVKYEYQMWTR